MGTLRDYYKTGADSSSTVSNILSAAQTFTASASYDLNSVKLKLYKVGSPGTVTLKIRATDGAGKPTGSALATGTTNGNTLTGDSGGEWREFTLGNTVSLTSGTKYAICLIAAASSAQWIKDQTSPTYTTGDGYYGVMDANWTIYGTATDFYFETYDAYTFSPPTDITTVKRLVVFASNKAYYEDE